MQIPSWIIFCDLCKRTCFQGAKHVSIVHSESPQVSVYKVTIWQGGGAPPWHLPKVFGKTLRRFEDARCFLIPQTFFCLASWTMSCKKHPKILRLASLEERYRQTTASHGVSGDKSNDKPLAFATAPCFTRLAGQVRAGGGWLLNVMTTYDYQSYPEWSQLTNPPKKIVKLYWQMDCKITLY